MLLAGLFIGSVRTAQTQGLPSRTPLVAASTRQHFSETLGIALEAGQWANSSQVGGLITVPAGRTMVVDYVTGFVNIPAGQHPQMTLRVGTRGLVPTAGMGSVIYLHGTETPIVSATQHMVVASQPLGLHLEAGNTLRADMMRPQNETGGRIYASVTIYGYLE